MKIKIERERTKISADSALDGPATIAIKRALKIFYPEYDVEVIHLTCQFTEEELAVLKHMKNDTFFIKPYHPTHGNLDNWEYHKEMTVDDLLFQLKEFGRVEIARCNNFVEANKEEADLREQLQKLKRKITAHTQEPQKRDYEL